MTVFPPERVPSQSDTRLAGSKFLLYWFVIRTANIRVGEITPVENYLLPREPGALRSIRGKFVAIPMINVNLGP